MAQVKYICRYVDMLDRDDKIKFAKTIVDKFGKDVLIESTGGKDVILNMTLIASDREFMEIIYESVKTAIDKLSFQCK